MYSKCRASKSETHVGWGCDLVMDLPCTPQHRPKPYMDPEHACNPSTQEAESGLPHVPDQPGPYSKGLSQKH